MLYPKRCLQKVHFINFLKNVSKTQFYREKARIFRVYTWKDRTVSHCIHHWPRDGMPEFRHFMISKSNFNRKINKFLARIFQQGWYC